MPPVTTRILFAGTPSTMVSGLLGRLAARGSGARVVETLRDAKDSLQTLPCDLVLASESLPDGRGYELAELVTRRSGTLFVCVALSESCLWLPVVEQGASVLGSRAFSSHLLEAEMDIFLSAPAKGLAAQTASPIASRRVRPHVAGPIRSYRKTPAANAARAPLAKTLLTESFVKTSRTFGRMPGQEGLPGRRQGEPGRMDLGVSPHNGIALSSRTRSRT